jgi:hypothetical protein
VYPSLLPVGDGRSFQLFGILPHVDRLNAPSAASAGMSAPRMKRCRIPGEIHFRLTAVDESPEDWDSPKQTVICNSNQLQVRRNRHDALLPLANSERPTVHQAGRSHRAF